MRRSAHLLPKWTRFPERRRCGACSNARSTRSGSHPDQPAATDDQRVVVHHVVDAQIVQDLELRVMVRGEVPAQQQRLVAVFEGDGPRLERQSASLVPARRRRARCAEFGRRRPARRRSGRRRPTTQREPSTGTGPGCPGTKQGARPACSGGSRAACLPAQRCVRRRGGRSPCRGSSGPRRTPLGRRDQRARDAEQSHLRRRGLRCAATIAFASATAEAASSSTATRFDGPSSGLMKSMLRVCSSIACTG